MRGWSETGVTRESIAPPEKLIMLAAEKILVNLTLTIKIDHNNQRIYNFKLEAFMPRFVAKRLLYDFDKFF